MKLVRFKQVNYFPFLMVSKRMSILFRFPLFYLFSLNGWLIYSMMYLLSPNVHELDPLIWRGQSSFIDPCMLPFSLIRCDSRARILFVLSSLLAWSSPSSHSLKRPSSSMTTGQISFILSFTINDDIEFK